MRFVGRVFGVGEHLEVGSEDPAALTAASGLQFEQVRLHAMEVEIEGIKARVLSLADLIQCNRASGRTRDLVDAEALDLYSARDTALRGPNGTVPRVRRGGCRGDEGWPCRSAFRLRFEPDRRSDHIGFRVAAVRRWPRKRGKTPATAERRDGVEDKSPAAKAAL